MGLLQEISPTNGAPNSQVQDIVTRYERQTGGPVLHRAIGETQVTRTPSRSRRETNLGNFVADIMRETAGAEAALTTAAPSGPGSPWAKSP